MILYWREPAWFWVSLLPLLPMLWTFLRHRSIWMRMVDPSLRPWVEAQARQGHHKTGQVALGISWLLLCTALAGPRTPRLIPPVVQPDAAVIAVVDLSASMAARDVRPDRRRHAQAMLDDWVAQLPASLRIGVVVYAGHAHRLLPPTADQELVRHFVRELDSIRLPTLGNDLADALRLASESLAGADTPGGRHLLLISDGDLGPDAQRAAETAVGEWLPSARIRLHVIGVGGAEAVGVPRSATEPLVIDGERIVSRRDARWLRTFAGRVDGDYHGAEAIVGWPLARVLGLPGPHIDPADNDRVLWDEWFGLPLLAGIVILVMALRGKRAGSGARATAVAALIAVLSGGCGREVFLDASGDQARAALDLGDYTRARSLYAGRDGYDARFAEGVACYRLADFPCALQAFAAAAWQAPDDTARGRAAFNLGNTHFRLGDFEEASVLFAEAGKLGVSPELTAINREFADSLAATVRRHLADVAETQRRADWRAAAREMPEVMRDRLAEGIRLSTRFAGPAALAVLSADELRMLVAGGIERHRDGRGGASTSGRHWVKSEGTAAPEGTAGLFNRLLPMEVGILSVPGEPYRIEGSRPW